VAAPVRDEPTAPESGAPPERSTEHRRHRSQRERMRIKIYRTGAMLALWIGFVMTWLFFYAISYGVFENIGVIIAAFFLMGGLIGMMWVPKEAGMGRGGWRVRLSIASAVVWIAFVVLWLPFFAEEFTIYLNAAILLASSFAFITANAVAWSSIIPGELGTGLGRRVAGSFVLALAWLAFMVIWLWQYAEAYGYVWEQNAAILILAGLPVYLILTGIWIPWSKRFGRTHRTPPEIVLLFVWLVLLFVWFWLYGKPFNVYQNMVIVLLTFLAFASISRAVARRR